MCLAAAAIVGTAVGGALAGVGVRNGVAAVVRVGALATLIIGATAGFDIACDCTHETISPAVVSESKPQRSKWSAIPTAASTATIAARRMLRRQLRRFSASGSINL